MMRPKRFLEPVRSKRTFSTRFAQPWPSRKAIPRAQRASLFGILFGHARLVARHEMAGDGDKRLGVVGKSPAEFLERYRRLFVLSPFLQRFAESNVNIGQVRVRVQALAKIENRILLKRSDVLVIVLNEARRVFRFFAGSDVMRGDAVVDQGGRRCLL